MSTSAASSPGEGRSRSRSSSPGSSPTSWKSTTVSDGLSRSSRLLSGRCACSTATAGSVALPMVRVGPSPVQPHRIAVAATGSRASRRWRARLRPTNGGRADGRCASRTGHPPGRRRGGAGDPQVDADAGPEVRRRRDADRGLRRPEDDAGCAEGDQEADDGEQATRSEPD